MFWKYWFSLRIPFYIYIYIYILKVWHICSEHNIIHSRSSSSPFFIKCIFLGIGLSSLKLLGMLLSQLSQWRLHSILVGNVDLRPKGRDQNCSSKWIQWIWSFCIFLFLYIYIYIVLLDNSNTHHYLLNQ